MPVGNRATKAPIRAILAVRARVRHKVFETGLLDNDCLLAQLLENERRYNCAATTVGDPFRRQRGKIDGTQSFMIGSGCRNWIVYKKYRKLSNADRG